MAVDCRARGKYRFSNDESLSDILSIASPLIAPLGFFSSISLARSLAYSLSLFAPISFPVKYRSLFQPWSLNRNPLVTPLFGNRIILSPFRFWTCSCAHWTRLCNLTACLIGTTEKKNNNEKLFKLFLKN